MRWATSEIRADNSTAPWITVVGVAGDIKFRSLRQDENAEPVVYTPLLQSEVVIGISLIVRTKGDPSTMLASLRSEVQAFDPDFPVYSVATLENRLRDKRPRLALMRCCSGYSLSLRCCLRRSESTA